MTKNDPSIGTGPTSELSLRVSVATLCRVVFPRPEDGTKMLALEHKAFLDYFGNGSQVIVKAQPFGGAVTILDTGRLTNITGGFNFDSKRSRVEGDFRIFINPASWDNLRDFCTQSTSRNEPPILETDPTRELVEEFHDALGIQLEPQQYSVKQVGTVVENEPAPTANLRASGSPTARIYFIYEVLIDDPELSRLMVIDSETNNASVLQERVLEDARKGGKGRSNTVLAVPEEQIRRAYLSLTQESNAEPFSFEGVLMEGNVAAVLKGFSAEIFSE